MPTKTRTARHAHYYNSGKLPVLIRYGHVRYPYAEDGGRSGGSQPAYAKE